ncbi:MAG: Nif3-like dinuclear metal center hexameric protein [bacterium]|nr:Nif3-like dinuclear metal center hexameric protein [bacterium]
MNSREISELLEALGRSAPWEKAAEWDPVGLQLGDPRERVHSIAVCHEVTEDVVSAVEADPVGLLVSYHPLLFEATTRLVAGPTPEGRALRLVRAGVALAVTHTNYDVAPGGAADALADALELEDVAGFAPLYGAGAHKIVTFAPAEAVDALLEAVAAEGGARVGNYTHCSYRSEGSGTFFAADGTQPVTGKPGSLNLEAESRIEFVAPASRSDRIVRALVGAHPYEEPAYDVYEQRGNAGMLGRIGRPPDGSTLGEIAKRAIQALEAPALRLAGDPSLPVERLAVIPGAGADFLPAAATAGANAVLTGDLTHHRARSALDAGIGLLDPGHAPTERPGLERLFISLAAQGLEVRNLLEFDPDPWRMP